VGANAAHGEKTLSSSVWLREKAGGPRPFHEEKSSALPSAPSLHDQCRRTFGDPGFSAPLSGCSGRCNRYNGAKLTEKPGRLSSPNTQPPDCRVHMRTRHMRPVKRAVDGKVDVLGAPWGCRICCCLFLLDLSPLRIPFGGLNRNRRCPCGHRLRGHRPLPGMGCLSGFALASSEVGK